MESENTKEIRIISLPSNENPFVVIDKPQGLPSAPLSNGDSNNAFAHAAKMFPELLAVRGRKECEYGLLHRLDTATRGLLVIAATDSAYCALQNAQSAGLFEKTYNAHCKKNIATLDGFPPFPAEWAEKIFAGKECLVESCFRPFGKKGSAVRPVTKESGKSAAKKGGNRLYSTRIKIEGEMAECMITAGYRHQVRCHLSWAGFAVKGDELYNPDFSGGALQFSAIRVRFPHPITNEIVEFSL